MKKTIRVNISGRSIKAFLPFALMYTSMVSFAGNSLPVLNSIATDSILMNYTGSPLPIPTGVVVTKNLNNKKYKIRLFTAADYKTLLFTVDGVEGNQYTLFVFDLDGKLVIQSDIKNRETGIVPEISVGAYLYEVLTEDTRIESGQLKIK